MKILKTIILKIILPLLILAVGLGVMNYLVKNRPTPRKEVKKETGALVSIFEVKKENRRVIVRGTGTVRAAQEIDLIPQVGGRVTYVSPSLVNGGFFKKGELLFRVEDIDYLLALEQAKAAKAKAEYDLVTMENFARVARMEWERLNKDKNAKPDPLVVYEPQLRNARASLYSAIAAVEQAEINLERTKMRAPFNCMVRSENIDMGQYINAGSGVAVLIGTDRAEITVPLSPGELGWLIVPKGRNGRKGSPATVQVRIGEKDHYWDGRIIRSGGEVDTKTRMIPIIIEVEDPYRIEGSGDSRPVLAVGTFVDVEIKGKVLTGVFPIPRTAFRQDATVWIMDEEDKLLIKKVKPVRMEREQVLIGKGLKEGDRVVLTTISGAADGMKLRPVKQGEKR